MKSKPFLVAIAAFAVTVTGVQAFAGTEVLQRAGLTQEQISAFEVAKEKREAGDFEGARDVLVEAGVDEEVLRSVHKAAHQNREAIQAALESGDYETFKTLVADSPFHEAIDSEEDFKKLATAHALKKEGRWDEANVIFDELGVVSPVRHGMGPGGRHMGHHLDVLTDEQREALAVAKKANDKEAVAAILKEAGIEMPGKRMGHW